MIRRRQTPWIQRWARPIIGAIAILGIVNTGYLTYTKLLGGEAICPTSGCEQVLSSRYAEMFGQPLALFGLLAYTAMAIFALGPLLVNPDTNKKLRSDLENTTWTFLFLGSTAMLVFSGYLMYIMFSEFVAKYGAEGLCYYCLASAICATAMFVLTLLGRVWDDVGQLFFTGALVSVVVLVGTLGIYNSGNTAAAPDGQVGPPTINISGDAEMALAEHLTKTGARMFGAYWCPHCHEQKELFGRQAFAKINYVECDPEGANSQTDLCRSIPEVQGYPSWEINGQYYSGRQSLQRLAELSGYTGPTNFQNTLGG
ncbi:vitamin K epoxide reductase family protein [Leptolyngbya sp. FACHB-8]|nr:vitamin K epoxide reductase family protein [Leptolyngbya sp. FACHB-8]MBD1913591.1 vitamin K epoxide reductase family protein [Leptolyngbya sp. FACHB-8]MBD2155762.1 vitamin K epoxide reductase family protein [Leptolyngbya sp. FACHB-16]